MPQRIIDAGVEPLFLFFLADLEPYFYQDDPSVDDVALSNGANLQKMAMLLFVDKAHHVFDACAVVPTAIDAARELSAADAEKKALIEKFSRPSGVSDEERLARAAAIIKRAANNGLTEIEVGEIRKKDNR